MAEINKINVGGVDYDIKHSSSIGENTKIEPIAISTSVNVANSEFTLNNELKPNRLYLFVVHKEIGYTFSCIGMTSEKKIYSETDYSITMKANPLIQMCDEDEVFYVGQLDYTYRKSSNKNTITIIIPAENFLIEEDYVEVFELPLVYN